MAGKGKIFNPMAQRRVFNRCVSVAMARKDIRSQTDLARAMGMSRSSLNKRINHGGWSDTELWRLFRVLDFTAEEVAQSMGVVA